MDSVSSVLNCSPFRSLIAGVRARNLGCLRKDVFFTGVSFSIFTREHISEIFGVFFPLSRQPHPILSEDGAV